MKELNYPSKLMKELNYPNTIYSRRYFSSKNKMISVNICKYTVNIYLVEKQAKHPLHE